MTIVELNDLLQEMTTECIELIRTDQVYLRVLQGTVIWHHNWQESQRYCSSTSAQLKATFILSILIICKNLIYHDASVINDLRYIEM